MSSSEQSFGSLPCNRSTSSFAVAKEGLYRTLKGSALTPQGLQWPWLCAFEEPARADAQAMMPGGQPRRVHGEPSLTCEWSPDDFAAREHGRVFGAETERLSQLNVVFRLELVASQRGAHVARA